MSTQLEPIFGQIPQKATHWGAKRLSANGAVRVSWAAPGASAESREWPLSELSSGSLRERWGAGQFEILWVAYDKSGVRRALGRSPGVTVLAPPVEVASPPPPPPEPRPRLDVGLDGFMALHRLIQTQADAQIERDRMFVRELLSATSAQRTSDTSALAPVLNQIASTLERFESRIAQLEAVDDDEEEDEDDDEEPNPFSAEGGPLLDQAKVAIANAAVKHGPGFVEAMGDFVKEYTAKKASEAAANGSAAAAASPS